MVRRDLRKALGVPAPAESLAKRKQNFLAECREKQREYFWSRRDPGHAQPTEESVAKKKKENPRIEMLKKWKEEKIRRMEEERKRKKPIFKVGVVHRKATGSPVLTADIKNHGRKNVLPLNANQAKVVKEREGVTTRLRAKAMKTWGTDTIQESVASKETTRMHDKSANKFCKIERGKKKLLNSYSFKAPIPELPLCNRLTVPYSPKMSRRSIKATVSQSVEVEENILCENEEKHKDEPQSTLILNDTCFSHVIGKANETEEELKVQNQKKPEVTLKSPVKTDDYVLIHYSPYVTIRKSGRNSFKKKKSLNIDEEIQREENQFRCRIFSFRKYIECETRRLLEARDKWRGMCEDFQEIPADVEGDINSVIGKTNLLTSDKFMQFKDLIDKCENGDPLIKVDDLQGFQDWVSLEVEKIDADFYLLEKLKSNNWVREETSIDARAKSSKVTSNKISNRKPVVKSKIHAHIMAARKLLKNKNTVCSPAVVSLPIFPGEDISTISTPKSKNSILKDVLNSNTNKMSPVVRERRNSGLEIMIASQKNKLTTPLKVTCKPLVTNCEEVDKENQTPCQSILRKKIPSLVTSYKQNVIFDEFPICHQGLDEKCLRPLVEAGNSTFVGIFNDLGLSSPSINPRLKSRSRFAK